jgi:hypothetical protein
MWITRGMLAAAMVLAAVGCGSGDDAAPGGADAAAAPAPTAGAEGATAARANQAAAAQPAAVTDSRRCPPELTTPDRAEGAPVDDILGVRPGQTFDEVEGILACRDEGYRVETGSVWTVRNTGGLPTRQLLRASNGTPCSGQDIARSMRSMQGSGECTGGPQGSGLAMIRDATDEVFVAFTGMYGQEVAGGVWRSRDYEADAKPTAESLQQALIAKYGEPSVNETLARNQMPLRAGDIAMTWVYDLRGRRLNSENPMYRRCNIVNHRFFGSHRWSAECGLVVTAGIRKDPRNNLLADTLTIGIMNQKAFYDGGQAFEAAIAAAVEEQRQQAARDAASVQTDL